MAKTMTPGDLEALDRLEQKVRLLVSEMARLRTEQAKDAETGAAEMAALRQERDQVRSRVAGILEHLEGLDI